MIELREVRDPRAEKLREDMESELQCQGAVLAYVAMMSDVDIETGGQDESYVPEN